jgi:hypothetical protein
MVQKQQQTLHPLTPQALKTLSLVTNKLLCFGGHYYVFVGMVGIKLLCFGRN